MRSAIGHEAPVTALPARRPMAKRSRATPNTTASLAAMTRHDLRVNRMAPLTWGGSLGATCGLVAVIWPSISDSISKAMQSYPNNIKQAFGIATLDTVEKYVDAEMLSLIAPLALAFFAVRCVTRAIVGAEEEGHLDSLLSLPLSRRVLVASSFISTGVVLAAVIAVAWGITWAAGSLAGTHISGSVMAAGFANLWPLSMAFAGLALLAAGILHRRSAVTAIATGTLIAMYIIDVLGKVSPDLKPLRSFSAFRWYGSAVQNGFDPRHAVALTFTAVLLAAGGMELFRRRDVL